MCDAILVEAKKMHDVKSFDANLVIKVFTQFSRELIHKVLFYVGVIRPHCLYLFSHFYDTEVMLHKLADGRTKLSLKLANP